MICTKSNHVFTDLDDDACKCGAIVIGVSGIALDGEPTAVLHVIKAPVVENPKIEAKMWTLKMAPLVGGNGGAGTRFGGAGGGSGGGGVLL